MTATIPVSPPAGYVRVRVDGRLAWWPARSVELLRGGRRRAIVPHRGRDVRVVVSESEFSYTKPIGA